MKSGGVSIFTAAENEETPSEIRTSHWKVFIILNRFFLGGRSLHVAASTSKGLSVGFRRVNQQRIGNDKRLDWNLYFKLILLSVSQ